MNRRTLIRKAASFPKGSEERRSILAALKTASSAKVDFPSVSDPDRRAVDSLHKTMKAFARKHGESSEVGRVLDTLVTLNAVLHRAEESLY